jgi:hypothetical protein
MNYREIIRSQGDQQISVFWRDATDGDNGTSEGLPRLL